MDAGDGPGRDRRAWPLEVLSRAIWFVRAPLSAVTEAVLRPDTVGALAVAAAAGAALGMTGLVAALTGDGVGSPGADGLFIVVAGGAAAGGLAGVAFAALAAVCLHLSAHAVGGAGPFRSMQTVAGYSAGAGLLAVPAIVVSDALPADIGGTVRDAALLGTAVWWTVLAVLGVKVVYRTPWRAVPGALVLAVIGGAAAAFVSLAVLSFLGLFAVTVIVP